MGLKSMANAKFSRRDFLQTVTAAIPLLTGALSLLSVARLGQRLFSSPQKGLLPNILILVLDALSAKNMSLYGYPRQTTPMLEHFAQHATVYHSHYAAGNFTTPGTASLLCGVYPWTHRAFNFYGTTSPVFIDQNLFALLAGNYASFFYTHNPLVYRLAHPFHQHIENLFRVSDWCLDSNSPTQRWFQEDFGAVSEAEAFLFRSEETLSGSIFLSALNRQFEHGFRARELDRLYRQQFPDGLPAGPFMLFTLQNTFDHLLQHLGSQRTPYLGYVHVLPPHDPYNTTSQFKGRFDDNIILPDKPIHTLAENDFPPEGLTVLRRKYDEFILYTDAEFGRLYQRLEQQGVLESTYVVVTSDHGEMFERGVWAHITPTLYEPITHIPLLIHAPGQRQRQDVFDLTSAVDVLPTLLQFAHQPVPDWCEGLPLQGLDSQEAAFDRSIYVVEAKSSSKFARLKTATLAIVRGSYKLIRYFGYAGFPDSYELYNLERDPEEMENLYSQESAVAQALQAEMQARLDQADCSYLS